MYQNVQYICGNSKHILFEKSLCWKFKSKFPLKKKLFTSQENLEFARKMDKLSVLGHT